MPAFIVSRCVGATKINGKPRAASSVVRIRELVLAEEVVNHISGYAVTGGEQLGGD